MRYFLGWNMALAKERALLGKEEQGCHSTLTGFPQKAKLGDHCTRVKNKAETFLQKQVMGILPVGEDSLIWHSRQSSWWGPSLCEQAMRDPLPWDWAAIDACALHL